MKQTRSLSVFCKTKLAADRINIHPNDGADLGLMAISFAAELSGCGPVELYLLNECPQAGLELSPKLWEKCNKPDKAILRLDGKALSFEKIR